jgi:signal transduction histidine kinase
MAGIALLALFEQQRKQAERSGIEVARALATAVDAELGRSIAVLQAMALGPALDTGDLKRYHETLSRVLETRPDWLTMTLADPSGRQLLNARRPFGQSLPQVLDLPSLEEVVRSRAPVIGSLTKGTGEVGVPVRVPVVRQSEVRYVLTAALKPEALFELLNRQRLPSDWVVSIFDARGQRVARSRQHAEFLGRPPAPTLQALMASGAEEGSGITSVLEGETVYTAYSRSRTTGWTIAIGVPPSVVEAGARGSLAVFGGGIALSLALGLLAALIVGRSIVAPMALLRSAAQALGRREPLAAPRTSVLEIDEVGSALAAAAEQQARHEVERDELLRREREARGAAEGANRAKDEFLAMLGHELRNPLGAISNAMRLLEHPRTDAETAHR